MNASAAPIYFDKSINKDMLENGAVAMPTMFLDLPVSVRSRVNPSRFQSLMVLSADVVTICLLSGLSRHFRTCLPINALENWKIAMRKLFF